jgi:hypothetical protein
MATVVEAYRKARGLEGWHYILSVPLELIPSRLDGKGAQDTIKSVQCNHNPATHCERRAVDSPISVDSFQVQTKELSLLQLLFSRSTTCTPLTE